MSSKYFYAYRPLIVAELTQHGFKAKRVPNIYEEDKPCWRLDLTSELAEAIKDIYTEQGIKIPAVITNALGGVADV